MSNVVQTAFSASSSSTIEVTLTDPTTLGNTLLVFLGLDGGTANPLGQSVAIGGVTTGFRKLAGSNISENFEVWAFPDLTTSSTSVSIATLQGAGTLDSLVAIVEVEGVLSSPLDAVLSGGSTSTQTSWAIGPTGTLQTSSELTIAAVYAYAETGSGPSFTPSGTWTTVSSSSATVSMLLAYATTSATTAQSFSGTFSTASWWGAGIVTLALSTATTSVSAYGLLPANLLDAEDQSFESGTIGSWADAANAASLSAVSGSAFEGDYCLEWVPGNWDGLWSGVQPTANYYAIPGLPYVASGWVRAPAGCTFYMSLGWSSETDSEGFMFYASGSKVTTSDSTTWYPVSVTGIAPGETLVVTPGIWAMATASGQTFSADFVFMAQSDVQILTDWLGSAFGSSPTAGESFMDMTPFVNYGRNPVSLTRGRQDAISEVQNGTLSFTVDNNSGWFTNQRQESPFYPNVEIGARTQLNASYLRTAAWRDMQFSYSLLELDEYVTFPLTTNAFWELNGSASEWGGNWNGTAGTTTSWSASGSGPYGFMANGVFDGTTHSIITTSMTFSDYTSLTVEAWLNLNGHTAQGIICGTGTASASNFYLEINSSDEITFNLDGVAATASGTIPASGWVYVAGVYNHNGGTPILTAYLGSASGASVSATASFSTTSAFSIGGVSTSTFSGSLAFVGVYANALTPATIAAHAQGDGMTSFMPFQTRYDGALNEIDYSVAPIGTYAVAQFNCRDILGILSNGDDLACWTKQRILLDSPLYHWTMDDAAGSLQAQETSGNGGPPLVQRVYGTSCSGQFAAGDNGVETQQDTPGWTKTTPGPFSSSTLQGYYSDQTGYSTSAVWAGSSAPLIGNLPVTLGLDGVVTNPVTGETWNSGWTIEVVCTPDMQGSSSTVWSTSNEARMGILSLRNSYWARLDTWMVATSASIQGELAVGNPWNATTTDAWSEYATYAWNGENTIPVTVAVSCTTGSVMTLWINGTSTSSFTVGSAQQGIAFDEIIVGDLGEGVNNPSGFSGVLSLCSVYTAVLSSASLSAHADMALWGPAQWLSGRAVAELAAIAQVPSYWSGSSLSTTGLSAIDYYDISDGNALTAMQQFEDAEAGLLYADHAGQLQMAGRDVRMGAGTPSLYLPPGAYKANLGHKMTDQYMDTSAAVQGTAGEAMATASSLSATAPALAYSIAPNLARVGPYPGGSVQDPTVLPVQTIAQVQPETGQPVPYAQDLADWSVYTNSIPPFKAASLTIDCLTMADPVSLEFVSPYFVAAQEINAVVSLKTQSAIISFPDVSGSLDFFVEGVSEQFSPTIHTLAFYTSPANNARCWIPGDPVYGVLDVTARIGISSESAKTALVANNPSDPGGPWLAPSYSTSMNQNTGNSGFVGASDQRGIWFQLQTMLSPPVFLAYLASTSQSIPSETWSHVNLQWVMIDTAAGAQGTSGYYHVPVSGFYEITAEVIIPGQASGDAGWVRVIADDTEARVLASSSPIFNAGTSLGIANSSGSATFTPALSTRVFLPAGAVVSLQTYITTSQEISSGWLSLEFIGFGEVAD